MALVKLDKFEILWLCEGAMGKSHLRWSIYDKMIDEIFPILSDDEREFIYTYLKRDTSWLWEKKTIGDTMPYEYWLQTLARYNPTNQFTVRLRNGRITQTADAYLWNGKYYTTTNRFCAPEYIKSVKQKPYKQCCNKWCGVKDSCKRFTTKPEKDVELVGSGSCWTCDKCDLVINNSDDINKKEI